MKIVLNDIPIKKNIPQFVRRIGTEFFCRLLEIQIHVDKKGVSTTLVYTSLISFSYAAGQLIIEFQRWRDHGIRIIGFQLAPPYVWTTKTDYTIIEETDD